MKKNLIKNHAKKGDLVVLLGGSTGRDGIGGSQFASDSLESQNRSAVQIPDPFIEKLIIEAILEARNQNLIHAMKDLGGGGPLRRRRYPEPTYTGPILRRRNISARLAGSSSMTAELTFAVNFDADLELLLLLEVV
jgi:hypothetical protein